MKEERPLGETCAPVMLVDLWIDVTAYEEKVLKSVTVIVQKAFAPTEEGRCWLDNAHFRTHVGKAEFTVVPVKHFVVVGKVRIENTQPATMGKVTHCDAHGGGLGPSPFTA